VPSRTLCSKGENVSRPHCDHRADPSLAV